MTVSPELVQAGLWLSLEDTHRWAVFTTMTELNFIPWRLEEWAAQGAFVWAAVEFSEVLGGPTDTARRVPFDPQDLSGPRGFVNWVRVNAREQRPDWRVSFAFGAAGAGFRPCSLRDVLAQGARQYRRALEGDPAAYRAASLVLHAEWL